MGKKLPFEIGTGGIKMAAQSGDVILGSRDARQIIVFDKTGNKLFKWGPRIDRQPMGTDISDDGSVILYATSRTEKAALKSKDGGWDTRIHYITRKGKELWNKQYSGAAYLSPDGKMVAIVPSAGEGADLIMLDSQGKILWKYTQREIIALKFSPDSNYILFSGNEGLHLLDKSGNLLWKKYGEAGADWGSSISEGATYIFDDVYNKVYDKQGNVIFEGEADVSGDGKRLMVIHRNEANKFTKISILSLPDKTVIREYIGGGFLSHDGRFLIALSTSGNQLVIDTLNQTSSEIPIANASISEVASTKDGKYLLFVVGGRKLLFYQIY